MMISTYDVSNLFNSAVVMCFGVACHTAVDNTELGVFVLFCLACREIKHILWPQRFWLK